ncbi:PREDICTED: E3 ubiquitin-protein ligase TRIM21-like [Cyprinodon variegatus]|uniref:E3 ubiquitin-protein ligase TRIM21-like n=1 Tax=Cyprinodon variegatus TaxID=28743 RepID=UPI000742C4EA|nr:PREDICTED: E3 ubiquitin-protein ligase TRIM21-like [Cyprinodon variegatus]
MALEDEIKAEDVLHALEELGDEEFDKFKWYLQQPESLPGVPPIKKSRLERAKSTTVVELMQQTYTLQRCLKVTKEILKKLHRNDLVQLLLQYRNSKKQKYLKHNRCKDDEESKECEDNEGELRKKDKVQRTIKKIRRKIQEIKDLVKTSNDAANREKAESTLVFMALRESAERELRELIKKIEDKQKTTEKEAEDFIADLEQEISELMKRSSEQDFQQSSLLKADPPKKKWVEDRVYPPSYEGTVDRAVTQLKDTLWEEMKKQLELKRVQQYAVDLTLDPDTAHPKLILSDDGKQVKHGDVWQDLPDNKERFSDCVDVLACQSFSSGSFYFEVQVKGKTDWDLGVAKDSINRKGFIDLSIKNGFWTIVLRNGNQYLSGDNSSDHVYLPTVPERVGVFVDYEKGLVSFYDVDTAALIYSFSNCCFTEKLKPYFSPYLNKGGTNSAPLIICTVNQARCCCYEAS